MSELTPVERLERHCAVAEESSDMFMDSVPTECVRAVLTQLSMLRVELDDMTASWAREAGHAIPLSED